MTRVFDKTREVPQWILNPRSSVQRRGKYWRQLWIAQPAWANREAIRRMYRECPEGMVVDHIVPLCSPYVCGLHYAGNLQYLTKEENQIKSNHQWPDCWNEQMPLL